MGKLVAYGGFSGSNYLRQPYDSSQDFGTGDFCLMMWINGFDTSSVIYDRLSASELGTVGAADKGGRLYLYHNNTVSFAIEASTFNTGYALLDSWQHIALVRSNGAITFYVNGEPYYSTTNTGSIGGTNPITHIGTGVEYNNTPYSGYLSLLRISATAPTPEQMSKIYRDEAPLFQENAQATLYGSSDAVTALAYDDSTELLHVGTSAGRSVFQGLKRVDNTTTAVGAAISASNSMVAED